MTKLRDYAYSDDGTPITGVTVNAYVIGADTPTDTDTTDSTGIWEFPDLPDDGYDVKLVDGSSTRWLRGNVSFQADKITSYVDGVTAPLEDASIDASMLKNIAADTATEVSGNTNSLEAWLGTILTLLASITGETNWYTAPSTSLTDLNTTISTSFTTSTAVLSADTNILDNAWADGPTLSLSAGTYLLTTNAVIQNSSGFNSSTVEARLWDGTTTYASGAAVISGGTDGWDTISLSTTVTLAATTTVKLSCRELSGATSGAPYMRKASAIDSDAHATQISALKILSA